MIVEQTIEYTNRIQMICRDFRHCWAAVELCEMQRSRKEEGVEGCQQYARTPNSYVFRKLLIPSQLRLQVKPLLPV